MRVLAAILLICGVLLYGYSKSPASVGEVKALAAVAAQNSEANVKMQRFLEQHPTPTNSELADIRRQVNESLVLATSREVTGNAALPNSALANAEVPAANSAVSPPDAIIDWGWKLLLAGLLLGVLINFPRMLKSMRDGR